MRTELGEQLKKYILNKKMLYLAQMNLEILFDRNNIIKLTDLEYKYRELILSDFIKFCFPEKEA